MQRTLLAVLILNHGRPLSVDRLIDELWPETPPKTARKTLHGYAWRLRNVLGSASPATHGLETVEYGYRLMTTPQQVDFVRFEHAVRAGIWEFRQDRPAAALPLLDEALSLWRGPTLDNVTRTLLVTAFQARMEELHLLVLEHKLTSELILGNHITTIAQLRSLVIEYPLRERLRELLMRGLHHSGREAEALMVYHEAARVLDSELGIRPGSNLQRLYREIRQGTNSVMQR